MYSVSIIAESSGQSVLDAPYCLLTDHTVFYFTRSLLKTLYVYLAVLSLVSGAGSFSGCVDFSLAVVCKVRVWGLIIRCADCAVPSSSPSQKSKKKKQQRDSPLLGVPLVEKGHLYREHARYLWSSACYSDWSVSMPFNRLRGDSENRPSRKVFL